MNEIITPFSQIRYIDKEFMPAGTPVWTDNVGIITGAGRSRFWWRSDFFSMHILSRGRGFVRVQSSTHSLARGEMFCLWPGYEFEYYKNPDEPWEVYWLNLTGVEVRQYVERCGFAEGRFVVKPPKTEAVIGLFAEIFGCFLPAEQFRPYRLVSQLYAILDGSCHYDKVSIIGENAGDPARVLVDKAKAVFASGGNFAMNVSELAAHLKISRSTLFQAFRKTLGISPITYLLRTRLERAKYLLKNTSFKIAVIAEMSGFGHEKYFQLFFRKSEKIPPGQWRKSHSVEKH